MVFYIKKADICDLVKSFFLYTYVSAKLLLYISGKMIVFFL